MKINIKVLSCLFVGFSLVGCRIISNIRTRQEISLTIQDIEKVCNAEQIYKTKYGSGSYGSVKELTGKELLEPRFADTVENGFRFNLKVEKEHYTLSVTPESEEHKSHSADEDEISFFADESGIIRAGFKPNTPATSEDYPIHPK